MTSTALTVKQVRDLISVDTLSLKNGVFTARRGFFYTHGGSSEKLAARIQAALPQAVILDQGEVWKAFRGGASVANQSHWFVKFTLGNEAL